MKSKPERQTGTAGWRGGVIRRVSWLCAITLSAGFAGPLDAAVIDDFHECPGWDGANNPSGAATFECGEEQMRIAANFTTATNPDDFSNTFGNIYYSRGLPLGEYQTRELRVELVSANQDNVFAYMGTMTAAGGEYFLIKDRNEIGLLKWSAVEGCSVAFWESRPLKNAGVVLVLSLTPIDERLLLEAKVVDKVTRNVLYQKAVVDGPGNDWPVPDPAPHGWTLFQADAGPAYDQDITLVWLAMQHQTDGQQGLAEIRLDNFETDAYPSPYLKIGGGATLLTWPEDTAEEQIVVGADSLASSAWMPCAEPIYNRVGEWCMPVPTAGDCQFWKLVSGTQFIDSFNPPKLPYVAKGDWVPVFANHGDSTRIMFTNVDGALRIYTVVPRLDGKVILMPPGPAVLVGDFYASVDILKWPGPGKEVGPWVRGNIDTNSISNSNGYIASYSREHNKVVLWDGSHDHLGPSFTLDPAARHRLSFWGVGNNVSMRLMNLETGASVDHALTFSRWSQGPVVLFIDTLTEGTFDITLDNFFITGTKP